MSGTPAEADWNEYTNVARSVDVRYCDWIGSLPLRMTRTDIEAKVGDLQTLKAQYDTLQAKVAARLTGGQTEWTEDQQTLLRELGQLLAYDGVTEWYHETEWVDKCRTEALNRWHIPAEVERHVSWYSYGCDQPSVNVEVLIAGQYFGMEV